MIDNRILKYENRTQEILFLLIALVFCTPILTKSYIVLPVCLIGGFYLIRNLNLLSKQRNVSLYHAIVFFLVIIFGYRLIGYSDAAWGNYLNQLSFYFCMLFMVLLQKGGSPRKMFLWLIFAILVYNIVDNIILGYLYPEINYARLYQDENFMASINGGGPSFYMLILFVFNICFFSFLNCKRKKLRIPLLIVMVLAAVYVLGFCYKGITVLFLLMSPFVIYMAKRTKRRFSFVIVSGFIILIIVVLVELFSESVIDFIKEYSPNERLTVRLVTLIDDTDAEANTYTVTGRTTLYFLSIKTWLSSLSNFLIGIGDHRVQFGAAKTGIGQHADLLDILAIYGLVGLLFIVTIFKNAFRIILSYFDNDLRFQVSIILMLFVMYGAVEKIFNPPTGLAIFLLLPLSNVLVNKNKQ